MCELTFGDRLEAAISDLLQAPEHCVRRQVFNGTFKFGVSWSQLHRCATFEVTFCETRPSKSLCFGSAETGLHWPSHKNGN